MCRMIAVIGDRELQERALRAFHRLGRCGNICSFMTPGHLDGWGIGAYHKEDDMPVVTRSPGSVDSEQEEYLRSVADAVQLDSPVAIGHFRKASQGEITVANTHPFVDLPWMFCHNGTVKGLDVLGPRPAIEGNSDSEELFQRWRQAPGVDSVAGWIEWLATVEQRCQYTSLTSLLTNGRELVAVRRVGKPFDPKMDPKEFPGYYTLYHWQQGKNHAVSSEILPELGSEWRLLELGENLVLSCR